MNVAGGPLDFVSTMSNSQFRAAMMEMKRDISSLTNDLKTQGSQIETFASKAAKAAAGFLSIQAAAGFLKSMVAVRGEFQQLEIAFSTMLKSKVAGDRLMAEAVKLAAITPFTLKDVAAGAKQLLAYGFAAQDITKNLTMLGNVASGVGSQLSDVVYLYGTLRASGRVTQIDINQFANRGIPIYEELAKVIGKGTDQVREYVTAGKIGFPQIEQAFANMTGPAGKFFNLMQEQSKSLTGQLSNLEDAWDRMLNSMGKSQEGIIGDGIQLAISLVDNYEKVIEVIELLIITYGAYRAALVLTTLTTSGLTAVETLHYGMLVLKDRLLSKSAKNIAALTASTAAYTAAIAALVAISYSLIQYQDGAEIAAESLADATDKGARAYESEEEKINSLIKTMGDHSKSKREQKDAYDSLLLNTGSYLSKYSQEQILAGEAKGAIDAYKDSVLNATKTNQEFADAKDIDRKLQDLTDKGADAIGTFDQMAISITNFGNALKLALSGDFSGLAFLSDKRNATNAMNKSYADDLKKAKEGILGGNPEVNKKYEEEARARNKEAEKAASIKKKLSEEELTAIKKYNTLLEQRQSLESEITSDIASARSIALGEEEQKIVAINKKYDDRLVQVEKLNKKLKESDRIDVTKVNDGRMLELGTAGVDAIINGKGGYKEQLEKKQKLFTEYEQAKVDIGTDKAQELYRAELGEYKSFIDYLEKDIENRKGDKSYQSTSMNAVAAPLLLQSKETERQRYQELIKEFASYADQRKNLQEKYQSDMLLLSKDPSAKTERKETYKKELSDLDDANVMKIDAIKNLYEGIDRLSDENAKKVIVNAESILTGLKDKGITISKELEAELRRLLADSKQAVQDRLPENLINLANQIDQIASSVSGVNEEFGKVISTVANVIGQVGNIKKSFDELKAAQGTDDVLGQIAAGAGMFSAAASVISTAISLISTAADLLNFKDRRLSRDIEYYNLQLNGISQTYKALERDIANSVGEKIFAEQTKQIELLNAEYQLLSQMIDAERAKRKSDQSKIDEYVRQMEEIPSKIEDIRRAIDESLIQTNFKTISDNIATALTDSFGKGADAAKSFDDVLNNVMINAVQNSLKLKYLEPIIKAFTDDLTAFSKANNGSFVGFNFDSWKFQIGQASDYVNAGLEAVKQYFPEMEKTVSDGYKSLADTIITDITTIIRKNGVNEMGNSITETISQAVLDGFKAQMVADGLKDFYDKLAEFQKGGKDITKEQVEALKAEYTTFLTEYNNKLTALEAATGLSFRKITDLDAQEAEKRAEEAKRVAEQMAEDAKKLAEQQIEDAKRLAEQQAEAIKAAVDSIADGITSIFNTSEQAGKDFITNFNKLFNDKILDNFKQTFLADRLASFYADFAAMTVDGAIPAKAQIEAMKLRYDAIIAAGNEKIRQLEAFTGQDLIPDQAVDPIEVPVEIKVDDSEFEALQDSILGVFAGLDGSIEDSTEKFESIMKKAVLNSFKSTYLAGALKSFYDQLNGYTANGATLSEVQIATLKEQYDSIIKGGKERMKEIELATGIKFDSDLAPGEGLKGKLGRELTETTASEFLGATYAVLEQSKITALTSIQLLNIARDNFNTAKAIEAHTLRTANNTQVLHDMAKDIKKMSGGRPVPDKYDLGL